MRSGAAPGDGEAAPLSSWNAGGGEHVYDRAVYDQGHSYQKHYEGIDLLKMFPAAFTMICCLIFSVPTWLIMSVAQNPALSYFSANWSYVVLIIPVVILSVHYVHLRLGAPSKFAVIAGLILPSIVLLIYANRQYMTAVDKMDKLFSTDCDTFPQKRTLQHSWEHAYNLYTTCLADTAASSNYSVAVLQQHFRVQDCEEYQAELTGFDRHGTRLTTVTYKEEWNYLAYLEENHYCAGWCYHGKQLWSTQPNKDACSIVVSHLYSSYVRPHSSQVCVMMLAALGATAVLLIVMGPALRKHGIDW